MSQAHCKVCGKPIEWIECDGKKIPIDARPPTYQFDHISMTWRRSDASVTHFATCSSANEFSKSKQNDATQMELDSKKELWWKK